MMPCENCRTLLLDHLYGLLDAAEAQGVESHLAACPACREVRDREAHAQGLFAQAAKVAFPHVCFQPPREEASESVKPILPLTVPAQQPARRAVFSAWVGWAVAASVLLAITASAWTIEQRKSVARATRTQADLEGRRTAEAKAALDQTRAEVIESREKPRLAYETAKQKHDAILGDWVEAEKDAIRGPADKKLAVRVAKPAALQPGAPNEFELTVVDVGATPPRGNLLAEVRDRNGTAIYTEGFNPNARGLVTQLRMPAEVWSNVAPDTDLFLGICAIDEKTGSKTDLQDPIRLYGPVYTTLLTTDRAGYHPGEPVFFRSLTLDRVTFLPPTREQLLRYELVRKTAGASFPLAKVEGSTDLVRVAEGQAEVVNGPDGKPLRGVGCGKFVLPPDLPDGDYSLTLTELPSASGYPPAIASPVTRSIRVQAGPSERFQKMIAFDGAGFAPGKTATGWGELKLNNNPVADVPVNVLAFAGNGMPLYVPPVGKTDANGRVHFGVVLPPELPSGEVRVKLVFQTPDRSEQAGERVPVIGRNLIVEFFPEGGTLVAGLENRVYVRATDPNGQPRDIRGVITDGRGLFARVETSRDDKQPGVNRGIGSFTITPTSNVQYWLKLEEPTGPYAPPIDAFLPAGAFPADQAAVAGLSVVLPARTGFLLPKPEHDGVVMTVQNPVTASGEAFRVRLRSGERERTLVIGAYTRGRPSDSRRVVVPVGQAIDVELMGKADSRGGVVRLTVFEEQKQPDQTINLLPVAERLVYRTPGESLNIALNPSNASPSAGYAFGLGITATEESGKPTAAVLYAGITNAGGTTAAKSRLLTTQFLLSGEVQNPDDLEYADFLLSKEPGAAKALDLVLATQGWRRFAEQKLAGAVPSPLKGLYLASVGAEPIVVDPVDRRQQKVYDTYFLRYDESAKEMESAGRAKVLAEADPSGEVKVAGLLATYDEHRRELADLSDRAANAELAFYQVDWGSWPVLGGLAAIAVLLAVLVALRRAPRSVAIPLLVASVGLLFFAAYLGTTFPRQPSPARDVAEETPTPEPSPKPPVEDRKKSLSDVDGSEPASGITADKRVGTGAGGVPDNRSGAKFAAPAPLAKGNFGYGGGGLGTTPPPKKPGANLAEKGGPGGVVRPMVLDPKNAEPKALPASPAMPALPAPGPGVAGPSLLKSDGKMGVNGAQLGMDVKKFVPDELFGKRDNLAKAKDQGRGMNMSAFGADRTRAEPETMFFQRELLRAEDANRRREAVMGRFKEYDRAPQAIEPLAATTATYPPMKSSGWQPLERQAVERVRSALVRPMPLLVREYAAPRPGSSSLDDESETILWQPVIVLPSDGTTTLSFNVGNAAAGYEVIVAGNTLNGRIGATRMILPVVTSSPLLPGPPK